MQSNTRIYKSQLTVPASLFFGVVAFVAAFALSSCDSPFNSVSEPSGSLVVSLTTSGMAPLMVLPEVAMEVAEYRLAGSGPGGSQFDVTASEGPVKIDGLRAGDWTFDVFAFNVDGIEIGYGRSTVTVRRGQSVSVGVTVRPLTGTGSLSLSATWPADELVSGNIVATFTSSGGNSTVLQFESTGVASAEYHQSEVEAGYYSLVLQLRDDETVVAGTVRTVRVVHGATTSGVFSFADLNHPTGDIEIVVDVDLHEPIIVEIGGVAAILPHGETATAVATVQNVNGSELNYTWYLNGMRFGDGVSIVVGGDLRGGTYRLDVIVFCSHGTRSGSAGHNFSVER